MKQTTCMIHLPQCEVNFFGIDADKYTAAWDDIRLERFRAHMSLWEQLEAQLEILAQEKKALIDDRPSWKKFFHIHTETSKKIAELNNKICCILDDIFTLKENSTIPASLLFVKLGYFLTNEGFTTTDEGCSLQVWTKEYTNEKEL